MAEAATVLTPPPIATNVEAAVAAIAARAAEDGDEWRIKILRKVSAAALPESVAIIDGATAEQIANPEPWLSRLSGGCGHGGSYMFRVVHAKDKVGDRPTALYTISTIGGVPKNPTSEVLRSPEWPRNLTLHYFYGQEDGPAPKKPTNLAGAPSTTDAVTRHPTSGDGSAGLLYSQLAQLQEERRKLDEDRHRMEMDAIRRVAEEDRKRLESKMTDMVAQMQRDQVPREDPMLKIVAVVTPLMAPILAYLGEASKAREGREAAQREIDARREEKRETERTAMLEKLASAGSEQAKVISVFTDSLAQTARAMVQTVAMVGELRQEPQDEGIMGVIKAGIGAWVEAQSRAPQLPPAPPAGQPARIVPIPNAPAPAPTAVAPTAEAVEEGDVEEIPAAEVINMMAQGVNSHEPAEGFAPDIVQALGQPEFVTELKGEGGMIAALQKRLGAAWANDVGNRQYLEGLLARVAGLAKTNGVDLAGTL